MSFIRNAPSAITACPAGDTGTTYTYSSGCTIATCSYTNPNDANETAVSLISSSGDFKCTKVCKAGYKRDASGRCTVTCPQPSSDLGLTAAFTAYGCKITSCTSSSGFPTSITATGAYGTDAFINGDLCTIACPAGSRQYTNTSVSPNRQDCAKCTSDYSLNPWIFTSACSLITNYCAQYGPIFQRKLWSQSELVTTATATQSGSTCTTTCTTGYVKDSNGVCRKCPNETPSSTSTVVSGVCVTTCKTNHTRDATYDAKEFNSSTQQGFIDVRGRTGPVGQLYQSEIVCPQCINGTSWDFTSLKCVNCSQATTTSTSIRSAYGGCSQVCRAGYYFNRATGVCDTCPAGSYCAGGGDGALSVSVQCRAGTYCPAGSTAEVTCSAGYSCPAGSISQTACTVTPATGYIWSQPGVTCATVQCRAGYYCPNSTTETQCRWNGGDYCPAGTVSATCPAGYYCSDYTSKVQCTAGNYCPAGSSSQTACTTAGYYCPAESSSQTGTACSTTCGDGKWKSADCTRSSDITCSTCTTCSGTQYQTAACSATAGTVCKPRATSSCPSPFSPGYTFGINLSYYDCVMVRPSRPLNDCENRGGTSFSYGIAYCGKAYTWTCSSGTLTTAADGTKYCN